MERNTVPEIQNQRTTSAMILNNFARMRQLAKIYKNFPRSFFLPSNDKKNWFAVMLLTYISLPFKLRDWHFPKWRLNLATRALHLLPQVLVALGLQNLQLQDLVVLDPLLQVLHFFINSNMSRLYGMASFMSSSCTNECTNVDRKRKPVN